MTADMKITWRAMVTELGRFVVGVEGCNIQFSF